YDASRSDRTYGGNVVGVWRNYSLNATYNRIERFYTTTSSAVVGTSPQIAFSRTERPLFRGSLLYFSVGSQFDHFDRSTNDETVGVSTDSSLSRFDVYPRIRYPFKKWQWFTVNSFASFRSTLYSRSLDPVANNVVDEGLNRRYFEVRADATGPVFTRV